MNNFFKMSLVAAAVAVSGTAAAGTFTGNNTVAAKVTANENAIFYSTEGLAVAGVSTTLVPGPVISYKLGAAYIVGDELIFTFTNAFDAKSKLPTTITVDTAEFNLISLDVGAKKVVYRVITGSAKTSSLFVLPQEKVTAADIQDTSKNGLVFTAANLVGNKVVASATKNNNVGAYDADTTVVNGNILAVSTTQFGESTVTQALNAVIDDSTPNVGKQFVNDTNDTLTVTYAEPTVKPSKALLGLNDGVVDLTASKFAPTMVVTPSAAIVAADYTFKSSVADAVVVATATEITVTYPSGASVPSDTLTITPKSAATISTVIPVVSFVAEVQANDSTTADIMVSTAAGAWSAVGSTTVNVPYMPYGTGLTQVIYANNTSASDAEVSVVARDEAGNKYPLGVVANIKAKSVSKLAGDIKDALAAQGFTSGKVALDITFRGNKSDAIGAGDINVHTSYNANATDRGFVTNTTNGAAK